jgi:hypothetical protein
MWSSLEAGAPSRRTLDGALALEGATSRRSHLDHTLLASGLGLAASTRKSCSRETLELIRHPEDYAKLSDAIVAQLVGEASAQIAARPDRRAGRSGSAHATPTRRRAMSCALVAVKNEDIDEHVRNVLVVEPLPGSVKPTLTEEVAIALRQTERARVAGRVGPSGSYRNIRWDSISHQTRNRYRHKVRAVIGSVERLGRRRT